MPHNGATLIDAALAMDRQMWRIQELEAVPAEVVEAATALCDHLDNWWFEADPDAGYSDSVKKGDPHPWCKKVRAALAKHGEGEG